MENSEEPRGLPFFFLILQQFSSTAPVTTILRIESLHYENLSDWKGLGGREISQSAPSLLTLFSISDLLFSVPIQIKERRESVPKIIKSRETCFSGDEGNTLNEPHRHHTIFGSSTSYLYENTRFFSVAIP